MSPAYVLTVSTSPLPVNQQALAIAMHKLHRLHVENSSLKREVGNVFSRMHVFVFLSSKRHVDMGGRAKTMYHPSGNAKIQQQLPLLDAGNSNYTQHLLSYPKERVSASIATHKCKSKLSLSLTGAVNARK